MFSNRTEISESSLREIYFNIFENLDSRDLRKVTQLNKSLNELVSSESNRSKSLWKNIAEKIGIPINQETNESLKNRVKCFVIDLKKSIQAFPENEIPPDIKTILKSDPTDDELRRLLKFREARDAIIFWKILSDAIRSHFDETENIFTSSEKVIHKASDFDTWCKSDQILPKLNQLQKLDFFLKKIHCIPREIKYLTQLENLKISFTNITSVPEEIKYLTQLKYLSLSNNKITTIPKEIRYLTQLDHLLFIGNKISQIPPEIQYLTQLKTLVFFGNEIKTIPPEIKFLTQIEELNLVKNQISQIPSEYTHLKESGKLRLG